jgi:hypothetical protein
VIARHLFHLLVAVALSLPPSVWAQQPARLPTIGILSDGGPAACTSGAPATPSDQGGQAEGSLVRYVEGKRERRHAQAVGKA